MKSSTRDKHLHSGAYVVQVVIEHRSDGVPSIDAWRQVPVRTDTDTVEPALVRYRVRVETVSWTTGSWERRRGSSRAFACVDAAIMARPTLVSGVCDQLFGPVWNGSWSAPPSRRLKFCSLASNGLKRAPAAVAAPVPPSATGTVSPSENSRRLP